MFVRLRNPNEKGNVAELAIAAAAAKLGIDISKPLGEHTRYDLIFGIGDQLLRIQCKWAPLRGQVVQVGLVSSRYRSDGQQVRSSYSSDEIDAVAAYCEELDECYLLPIELVAGMSAMHLRLSPARNGQRAALNWAADFVLSGAVAQLEERRTGSAKATGSSPVSSTSRSSQFDHVGAYEFRNGLGTYLQRANAGQSFLITRRGKPYVRLVPPTGATPDRLPPERQNPA